MGDPLEDRKARFYIFFTVGAVLFMIASFILGDLGSYSGYSASSMVFLSFILFAVSGFFWILAMLLYGKMRHPRKEPKVIEKKDEIPLLETHQQTPVAEQPIFIERKIPPQPQEKIQELHELAEENISEYFVASKELDKYHIQTCRWVKIIKPGNRVYFKHEYQARDAGYKRCKACLGK